MHSLDLSHLPAMQRAARYRELADEMRSHADSALTGDCRTGYLRMAAEWADMACKIEAEQNKVTVTVETPELAALLRRTP